MTRKAIPKRIRFEVLKRDSFKCQYCGASAPDVLLHIDHVKPVAKGGTNDILNLITSCESCNSGKSDKLLDDNASVNKARTQLETLQERREQLEMMMQWQEGLKDIQDNSIDRLCDYWYKLAPGFTVTANGRQSLQKLLRSFQLNEIFEAMNIAAEQYLEFEDDGTTTEDSWDLAWGKIAGICRIRKVENEKPYLRDLLYTRGILRKRVYVAEDYIMELLESAVDAGANTEWLKQLAKDCRNWTEFKEEVLDFIEENT